MADIQLKDNVMMVTMTTEEQAALAALKQDPAALFNDILSAKIRQAQDSRLSALRAAALTLPISAVNGILDQAEAAIAEAVKKG